MPAICLTCTSDMAPVLFPGQPPTSHIILLLSTPWPLAGSPPLTFLLVHRHGSFFILSPSDLVLWHGQKIPSVLLGNSSRATLWHPLWSHSQASTGTGRWNWQSPLTAQACISSIQSLKWRKLPGEGSGEPGKGIQEWICWCLPCSFLLCLFNIQVWLYTAPEEIKREIMCSRILNKLADKCFCLMLFRCKLAFQGK